MPCDNGGGGTVNRDGFGQTFQGSSSPGPCYSARTGQELVTPDRHDLPTSQVEGPAKMTKSRIPPAIGVRHSLPNLGGFLMINYRGLGWRAAVLRQRAGLSQVEAAKKAGITPATWARMESGQRCMDSTLFAVADAFQASLDWLVDTCGACGSK